MFNMIAMIELQIWLSFMVQKNTISYIALVIRKEEACFRRNKAFSGTEI